jgi:putrescine---pyruvate transaminase
MSNVDLREQDSRHHFHPMSNPVSLRREGPDMVVRGEGIYLYLSDGRKVMDTTSGLWNVNMGYGNKRICDAAYRTMLEMSCGHTIFNRSNPWIAALSEKLSEITPKQYQTFFFASSGSEANESAVKMARHYWRLQGKPEKRITIARRDSYHGATIFATSLTGQAIFHNQFGLPLEPLVRHAGSTNWHQHGNGKSNDEFFQNLVHSLEAQIKEIGPERIAALIGEPIQTGMHIPTSAYWQGIRALCDKYEILLIADEVVSGFGKSGRMFAFEHYGFEPDLFTIAKGITSGYFPLSAVALGSKVSDVIRSEDNLFAHVFTNSGHPVGAAVALETIAIIEEEALVDWVRLEIGPHFTEGLRQLLELPCVASVRSLGVMGGINLDVSEGSGCATSEQNDAFLDRVTREIWKRGATIRGGSLCLPMVITKSQIDEAFDIIKTSISEVWSIERTRSKNES